MAVRRECAKIVKRCPLATIKSLDVLAREALRKGYKVPKYVDFCYRWVRRGYDVRIYKTQSTETKYIYLKHKKYDIVFKVRFSTHLPRTDSEILQDCDFYVGPSRLGRYTTKDATQEVGRYFKYYGILEQQAEKVPEPSDRNLLHKDS